MKKNKGIIKGSELLKELPEETRKALKRISKMEWKEYHKKMKAKELKRMKSLMKLESKK